MDSHSFNFLPGRRSFGFSSYNLLNTSYLVRHNNKIRLGSRSLSEDSTCKFHKMDMENKLDQSCQFISGNNLANHLGGYSQKNSCQIKSDKQLSLLQPEHLNIMPISNTFLIGGYVGSKSQKENAHRTRINVQIQDFILSKLFDLMGNAVKSVTKCSKDLGKASSCTLDVTCTDRERNSGLTGLSKSITEIMTENNHISPIVDQNSKISSEVKQSYADVAKTSVQNTSVLSFNKLMGLKIDSSKPVTESKFNQYQNSKMIPNVSMAKQSIKIDHKPTLRTSVDVTFNHNIIYSRKKCKDSKTLYKKNRKKQLESNSEDRKKIVGPKCKLSGRNVFSQEKSKKPTRKRSDKETNCIIGLTEDNFNKISIQIPEKNMDLTTSNHNKQKVGNNDKINLESTDITIQFSEKSKPTENVSKVSNPMLFELPPKNYCELTLGKKTSNYTPTRVTFKQDFHRLNRMRATSECSIDSEDSFIVFTNECDHSNNIYVEESEDTFWSDDSFSDDGFCIKDCRSWTQIDKFGHCSNSNEVETKPKKKVRFADEKTLVKVHRMVAWDYAHRMARIGPWETCARDSARFKSRICQIGNILNYILDTDHRKRIYLERFSS